MASSPPPAAYTQSPTALSPPHPAYTHIFPTTTTPTAAPSPSSKSKKRPSIADGAGSAPSLKRRKASIMSTVSTGSAHPLRQTSFPPEDIGGPRSPSVDIDAMSIVSGSQVSAVGSTAGLPAKKKRGRKSKADKAREARDQTPSLINGRLGTGGAAGGGGGGGSVASGAGGGAADSRSTTGGQGGGGGGGGDQAEDDDDENDVVHMSITSTRRSEAQTAEEKRLRAMLTRCMDTDQFDRFGNWRAAKLPDQVVRRVVNATVSQSVPSQIVIAVRTVTKFYLCDIIRIAREVQAEWIAAGAEVQAADFTEDENGHIVLDEEIPWPGKVMSAEEEEQMQAAAEAEGAAGNSFTDSSAGMPTQGTMSFGSRNEELGRQTREVILREPPRGPLRPEHLREALRRYQASAQSQGIGSLRVWQEQQKSGVERFPSRTGGRRIFK